MPTYNYLREDGAVLEKVQRITDPPLTECPDTGLPVKRIVVSGAVPHFKGSGFYETDYKGKK